MEQADILIIGGGAAGMMAAYRLSLANKKVIVLEARDYLGGRIHTSKNSGFSRGVELGAEFIHGELPVTIDLSKEAEISFYKAVGDMWRYDKGHFKQNNQFIENYDELVDKLNHLQDDLSINLFLDQYFCSDEYAGLRDSLRSFVAGYDTADPDDASTFALREELQNEDEGHQYRIEGGYSALINWLEREFIAKGGEVHLENIIKTIAWKKSEVILTSQNGQVFKGKKCIIALPLGVLQAGENETGALKFVPPIPEYLKAINQLGFGNVIKILLEFDKVFWEEYAIKQGADESIQKMGYLFTQQAIPTWWTQHPQNFPLLTGWIGGPAAKALSSATDEQLLELSLQSLSEIYKLDADELFRRLTASKIVNWITDPFTRGAYSYETVYTKQARKVLAKPIEDTVYFAGEAFNDGPSIGTVEAAVTSGRDAANLILEG